MDWRAPALAVASTSASDHVAYTAQPARRRWRRWAALLRPTEAVWLRFGEHGADDRCRGAAAARLRGSSSGVGETRRAAGRVRFIEAQRA
jgi:hypothetical protein